MPQGPTWEFKPTTEIEILEIINSLKNQKKCKTGLVKQTNVKKRKSMLFQE
jgi:hypothetical protein